MTYQILQASDQQTSISEQPYIPVGTDEAEFDQWLAAQGLEVDTEDDDSLNRDRAELFGLG